MLNPRLLQCDTLMLDMDGTLLNLAYDNMMWHTHVPEAYAVERRLPPQEAREQLSALYRQLAGTLDWYCLDHWSERLGIDVLALHRQHRDRITYLPGAEAFLQAVATAPIRVLLVTNSHRDTLAIKARETGLERYFDAVYSSHDVGHPKEEQSFWRGLQDIESFDPGRTLFVDDNVSVLHSAARFGVGALFQVTRSDTGLPAASADEFTGVESVAELVAEPG